jgi:predicted phage terminase large subunit-like protein
MPPRHTKSEFASYLFPSWFIGRVPTKKIMQATHTADLSIRFGRKVRNLMDGEDYRKVFPDVRLRADSKAAYRWETDDGGEYYAAGVGGSIAGRGADLFIVDDPHSEQDAMSPTALDNAWDWYMSGPRQRLQPGGAIIIVMTRWGDSDLTARLIKQQAMDPKADQWEVVEFPAIFDSGEPLWPEYWKLEELEKIKASITLSKWMAQYMQRPTSDASSLIKRDWWKVWEKKDIPRLQYVIQSYDTAFLKTRTADFSAIQTWGVFFPTEDSPPNAILLDAKKGRWEFPDLKRVALEEYKYWEPETVLIEAKASGTPLTQELRAMGIPVVNFTPSRGNDKHSRVNSISPLFESGLIWRPDTSWAEEVVEELASFPFGEHDDHVDCATQALMRFRQGGFIGHPDDYQMEITRHPSTRVYY